MIRAGLVLSFIAHLLQREPSAEHAAGCRPAAAASPGPAVPIGIFVQSPFHIAFCSRVKVQVSVETTETSPSRRPCQSRSTSFGFLTCGQQANRWPSSPVEHRVVQHQVLRAGLGEHRHAARLGRAHDVGPLGGGHVHDVELAAGRLAPLHRRAGSPRPRRSWAASSDGAARRSCFISSGVWCRAISSSSTRADSAWTSSMVPCSRIRSSVPKSARSSDCHPSDS